MENKITHIKKEVWKLYDLLEEDSLIKTDLNELGCFLNEWEFEENSPQLVKEWEKYKSTQIKNGMDLSLSFFRWLDYVKKINWRNE